MRGAAPPVRLPFGEWLPDLPDFANPGSVNILNVVPRTQESYGPMATPVQSGGTGLNLRCQGAYSAQDAAGNVYNFAGDANRLYLQKAGSQNYVDVSKAAGGPYSVGSIPTGFWQFALFGQRLIATDFDDVPQTFLLGTDSAFSDLGGGPPHAQYVAVIRDFVMFGNTSDNINGPLPQRLWWSAIGNPLNWPTPGTNAAIEVQSDIEDLQQTDLGEVTGLVGGLLSAADGAAFCERGIYAINYAGSPDIFSFQVAQGAAGTQAPLSIVQRRLRTAMVASVVYYLGEDGFYAFDGANTLPIGAEKIDRTFFNTLDPTYLSYVQGVADPNTKLVFFAFMGPGNAGLYNRLFVYNWDLNRWAPCDISATPAEWLMRIEGIGYTMETLANIYPNLDLVPYSLDSRIWVGGVPSLAMFDSTHSLNLFSGPNLAPTVETTESQIFPGRRAFINNTRALCDGGSPSISVGHRDILQNSVTYEATVPSNIIGDCPQRSTGRYTRFQLTLPAGSTFNHLQGIDVIAKPEGTLR